MRLRDTRRWVITHTDAPIGTTHIRARTARQAERRVLRRWPSTRVTGVVPVQRWRDDRMVRRLRSRTRMRLRLLGRRSVAGAVAGLAGLVLFGAAGAVAGLAAGVVVMVGSDRAVRRVRYVRNRTRRMFLR